MEAADADRRRGSHRHSRFIAIAGGPHRRSRHQRKPGSGGQVEISHLRALGLHAHRPGHAGYLARRSALSWLAQVLDLGSRENIGDHDSRGSHAVDSARAELSRRTRCGSRLTTISPCATTSPAIWMRWSDACRAASAARRTAGVPLRPDRAVPSAARRLGGRDRHLRRGSTAHARAGRDSGKTRRRDLAEESQQRKDFPRPNRRKRQSAGDGLAFAGSAV